MLLFLYPDILCPVTMLRIVQISRGELQSYPLSSHILLGAFFYRESCLLRS